MGWRLLAAVLLLLAGCAERRVPVAGPSVAPGGGHRPGAARMRLASPGKRARPETPGSVAEREVMQAQEAFMSRQPGSAERAAALYRDAAARGSAVAEYNLGVFHEDGIGVPLDRAAAATWFRRAASRHDPAVEDLASSRLAALAADGAPGPGQPAPNGPDPGRR